MSQILVLEIKLILVLDINSCTFSGGHFSRHRQKIIFYVKVVVSSRIFDIIEYNSSVTENSCYGYRKYPRTDGTKKFSLIPVP